MKKLLLNLVLLSSLCISQICWGMGADERQFFISGYREAEDARKAAIAAEDAALIGRYGTHIAGISIKHRNEKFDNIRSAILNDEDARSVRILDLWQGHGGMHRPDVEDLLTISKYLNKAEVAAKLEAFLASGAAF
jgi:hypothetical protein